MKLEPLKIELAAWKEYKGYCLKTRYPFQNELPLAIIIGISELHNLPAIPILTAELNMQGVHVERGVPANDQLVASRFPEVHILEHQRYIVADLLYRIFR